MQERSYTLPMYSVGRTSHLPSSVTNVSIDTHTSSTITSNDLESEVESSASTPELNLLLDKLTEILRFRSGCRRHFSALQPEPATNLKRLQTSSIELLHNTSSNIPSSTSTGAWKSSNISHKPSISTRSSHHHHKHHIKISTNLNKRRLPSLLQRLIDEGNLIKEAVHRLKSKRFSHTFKQQNILNTPSTPTTKPLSELTSRLPSSCSQLNDSNRGISWFLSSSVFGVNASTTNHSSGSGSPLRTYDRTSMEVGIHDG